MTNKEIKKLCRSFGADLVGVASVERFVNAPKGYHPTDVMPTAKSVISLGMVLPKDILEQDIRTYTDIRNEAVKKMDKVAADVAAELKGLKYKAVSIVSLSGKFVDGHFRSRVRESALVYGSSNLVGIRARSIGDIPGLQQLQPMRRSLSFGSTH